MSLMVGLYMKHQGDGIPCMP